MDELGVPEVLGIEIVRLKVACGRAMTVVLDTGDSGRIVVLQIQAGITEWIQDHPRYVDSLAGDSIQNKLTQRLRAETADPR